MVEAARAAPYVRSLYLPLRPTLRPVAIAGGEEEARARRHSRAYWADRPPYSGERQRARAARHRCMSALRYRGDADTGAPT